MLPCFARVGLSSETRLASQTLWHGKGGKRREWVCRECRTVPKQRRHYNDGRIEATEYRPIDPIANERAERKQDQPQENRPQHMDGQVPFFLLANARMRGQLGGSKPPQFLSTPVDRERWQTPHLLQDEAKGSRGQDTSNAQSQRDACLGSDEMSPTDDGPESQTMHEAELDNAVRMRDRGRVMQCLSQMLQTQENVSYMRALSDDAFTKILQVLTPPASLERVNVILSQLSRLVARQLGVLNFEALSNEYSQFLRHLAILRFSAGWRLTLEQYRILIKSARLTGDGRQTERLLKSARKEGLQPDLELFTNHLHALVWRGFLDPDARQKTRITPDYVKARAQTLRPTGFHTYSLEPTQGIRDRAFRVFHQMLQCGVEPNEEVYSLLLIATGRSGDMAGTRSFLKKIWGIDVDAFINGAHESTLSPRRFRRGSPLWPTNRLLLAIAHVFSIHNDLPTALRLVDYVARHYEITISRDVWAQLLEWTFVLSIQRTSEKLRGRKTGELPVGSVARVWSTMTSAPYHIQPTIDMYHLMIKGLLHDDRTPDAISHMEEAMPTHVQHQLVEARAQHNLRMVLSQGTQGRNDLQEDPGQEQSIESSRDEWQYRNLVCKRDAWMLGRWVKLLLASFRNWHRGDYEQRVLLTRLPRLLLDWQDFVPDIVQYETMTGFVELRFRTREEATQRNQAQERKRTEEDEMLRETPVYVLHHWLLRGHKQRKSLSWSSPPEQEEALQGQNDE